jgi:hypothetical protein
VKSWQVVAGVAILLAAVAGGRWWCGGRDMTRFAVIGEWFGSASEMPFPAQIIPGPGYDGQFFLRTALKPWTTQQKEFGISYDSPAYRQQRIMYPLLAWLSSGGNPAIVPLALVCINLLALIGLSIILAAFATRHGVSPIAAAACALSGGMVLSFGRDLAEPLAAFFVACGAVCFMERRLWGYVLTMTGAVLTREAALLTAGAALMSFGLSGARPLSPRTRQALPWYVGLLVPIAALMVWQCVLRDVWGVFPVLSVPSRSGLPIIGFVKQLFLHPYLERPGKSALILLYLAWYVWLGGLVARALWEKRSELRNDANLRFVGGAWLLWTAFASTFSGMIWIDDWGFSRILGEWSVLGFIVLIMTKRTPRMPFLLLTGLIFAVSMARLWARP